MHSTFSITPNVVDTPMGALTPGTWGVMESPRSTNNPSIVVLCIEQIERENATQILFFGPDPLGIFSIARSNLQVLAITDHVDVKVDPKAMIRVDYPDPESHTAVLFALAEFRGQYTDLTGPQGQSLKIQALRPLDPDIPVSPGTDSQVVGHPPPFPRSPSVIRRTSRRFVYCPGFPALYLGADLTNRYSGRKRSIDVFGLDNRARSCLFTDPHTIRRETQDLTLPRWQREDIESAMLQEGRP